MLCQGAQFFTYPACNLQYLKMSDFTARKGQRRMPGDMFCGSLDVYGKPRGRGAQQFRKKTTEIPFFSGDAVSCGSDVDLLLNFWDAAVGTFWIFWSLQSTMVPDFSPLVAMARYPLLYRAAAPGGAGAQVKPHCATSPCWYNYGKGSRVTPNSIVSGWHMLTNPARHVFFGLNF